MSTNGTNGNGTPGENLPDDGKNQHGKPRETPAGRRHTLTQGIAETLCELAELGMPRRAVLRLADVPVPTFYRWMSSAKKGVQPYLDWRRRFETAERKAEAGAVGVVANALKKAKTHPFDAARLAVDWLARTKPRDYGKRIHLSHEFEIPPEVGERVVQAVFDVVERVIDDEDLKLRFALELEREFFGDEGAGITPAEGNGQAVNDGDPVDSTGLLGDGGDGSIVLDVEPDPDDNDDE